MTPIFGSTTPNTAFTPSSSKFAVVVSGGDAYLEALDGDKTDWARVGGVLNEGRHEFNSGADKYRLQFRAEQVVASAYEVVESTAAGAVMQAITDYATAAELLQAYGQFAEVAPGDFVTRVSTSNGQIITALSGGPLQPGESRVELDVSVHAPCSLEVEASVIRARHQFATMSLYANGPDGQPDPAPTPINIVSISQSTAADGAAYTGSAGTVVTLVLESPVPGEGQLGRVYLSDWVHVTGCVDSRLNYQNATINYISADRKTLCFGFSDDQALPSLAIPVVTPPLGAAKLNFYNNAGGAHHGAGYRLTGTTATTGAVWSMFGGGDAQISGTLLGDHRTNLGVSTAPAYVNGKMGEMEIAATGRFRIDVSPDEVAFYSKGRDSAVNQWNPIGVRGAVKPGLDKALKARFRLYQPPGMSRPVAKIVSIVKTGTTTATITTDVPHGLEVGNNVGIHGVRDQTNFVNTSTAAVTAVPTSTSLQVTLGSAVTATSYGGTVSVVNGGVTQPGVIAQVAQSIANKPDNAEWLVLTGNATWAGLAVGDYVNLHGVRVDGTGADLLVDGAWEVAGPAGTTLWLKPIYSITGARVSPATPTIGGTVNCGGTVILRTTLRAHDIMLKQQLGESIVRILGQGGTRLDQALPVALVNGVQGFAAHDAPANHNPVTIGAKARNANPTPVSATGDVADLLATMLGALVVKPYAIPEAEWAASLALSTTTAAALQAAAAAGLKRHITGIQAINTGAAAVDLIVLDGATERWRLPLPVNVPVAVNFHTGLTTTSATALNVNLSAAGTVRVNAQGYTAP